MWAKSSWLWWSRQVIEIAKMLQAQWFTCESGLSGDSLIARYNDFVVLVPG